MKYVYLLSVITLLSSCKTIKTSNCSPYNIIEITHWGTNETDKRISFCMNTTLLMSF